MKERLKSVLAPFMVRVRRGPMKGRRWSPASGIRFVRGDFKREKVEAMAREIGPGAVVYDVGAHVGYTAVLAAKRVGPEGLVVAFEPRPLNLRFLRLHLSANGVENVQVVTSAVGERSGEARFDAEKGSGTGRLAEDGTLSVSLVSLDELVASGEIPPPDFIKVDVEGGEGVVLEGGREVLERHRPVLFLATHGLEIRKRCLDLLEEAGYEWTVLREGANPGESELLVRHPEAPALTPPGR